MIKVIMALPRMKISWCGCDLQIGTKIVSIVSLLLCLGSIALRGIQIYLMVKGNSSIFDDCYRLRLWMYLLMVTAGCSRLIPSALLIRAAYTRAMNRGVPWLVLDTVFRLVDIGVLGLASLVQDLSTIVIAVIRIVLGQYLWWVVYSFYRQIKEEEMSILHVTENGDISSANDEDQPLLGNDK